MHKKMKTGGPSNAHKTVFKRGIDPGKNQGKTHRSTAGKQLLFRAGRTKKGPKMRKIAFEFV